MARLLVQEGGVDVSIAVMRDVHVDTDQNQGSANISCSHKLYSNWIGDKGSMEAKVQFDRFVVEGFFLIVRNEDHEFKLHTRNFKIEIGGWLNG